MWVYHCVCDICECMAVHTTKLIHNSGEGHKNTIVIDVVATVVTTEVNIDVEVVVDLANAK